MTGHHIVNERHQEEMCIYCGKEISKDKFETIHDIEKHYKEKMCSNCGKRISIRVDWIGCGNDSWKNGKKKGKSRKLKTIENIVESMEVKGPPNF